MNHEHLLQINLLNSNFELSKPKNELNEPPHRIFELYCVELQTQMQIMRIAN